MRVKHVKLSAVKINYNIKKHCKVVCLQIIYLKVTYSLPTDLKIGTVKDSGLLVAILCTCCVMKVDRS